MAMDTDHDELTPLGDGPVTRMLAGVHRPTGESYALKVYPGRVDRHTKTELNRELSALASLRGHDTVLLPLEYTELGDGRFAMRRELCAQSLPGLVGSAGPLSIAGALALGDVLASTLVAAHRAGIVHGGVTPGNVLFRRSGAPALSDFGLVLRQTFLRAPEHGVAFLPPETVRDGTTSERADLYGLGAVLYYALSGRSPHQGRTGEQPGELTLRVLSSKAPPLDRLDLPRGLGHLVSSLLENNPDARPLDAAAVAARLGALRGPGASGPVRQDSRTPLFPANLGDPIAYYGPKTKPRSRTKTGLLIGAAGGLVVLVLVAVLLLRNQPAELPGSSSPAQPGAPASSTRPVPTTAPDKVGRLDLDDPVDHGDYVALSWHSPVPSLYYVLFVFPEGKEDQSISVQQNTTYEVQVAPAPARYCFQIKGTNGADLYRSLSKPLRGATCP
ncbi:serine/threonine protein kinase [Amycolatopsis sp. H20-H5]|uniref:serine/threonine protein kinase n=1 Tax=Amycolatopsis sp. H20-H5 TaxID=3046309 RepID=UPI002DB8ED76|nr:protein kinase [Amycolatopsis sp. H20-H5]MEC3982506.1 protein kinase [Amycolatopsis sp. H20-H5]